MAKADPVHPSRVPVRNPEAEGMDWLALAEYLWCHQHRARIFQSQRCEAKAEAELEESHQAGEKKLQPTPIADPQRVLPQKKKAEDPQLAAAEGNKLAITSPPQTVTEETPSGKAFQVPVSMPVTLPGQRELAKALRPLARRVRRGRLELDVEATVDRTAWHGGLFQPQMRRARERWLEVDLLVDSGESVAFWQGLAGDVERMLAVPGAFRRIRRWNLRSVNNQWVVETPTGTPASVKLVSRERVERCILVLTDTLSESWFGRGGVELLTALAAKAPTALLHLLPSRLWERSGLGQGITAKISSQERGTRNPSWRAAHPGGGFPLPAGLAVPCINFEAVHFSRLAGVLSGAKGNSVQGLLLLRQDTAEEPQDEPRARQNSAAARVEQFFISASDEAARLACYLAATPLVPAIMRMVQDVFMKQGSRHWHLTEVLCSGLVQPSPVINEIDGMPCYDWLPEVRPLLLAQSPVADTRQVWRQVGTWLTGHQSPQIRHLAALMQHPQGNLEAQAPAESRFFAEVNVAVWQSWGGEWAERGRQLAKRLEEQGQQIPPAQPLPVPQRPLEGRQILWVDDNPSNNEKEKEQLVADGADVTLAESTTEALELLQQQSFDAIISDMGRREGRSKNKKAGLDLLKTLREAGDQIPCAFFSAPASFYESQALKRGALVCSSHFGKVRAALLQTLHLGLWLRPMQAADFSQVLKQVGVEKAVADRLLQNPTDADWDIVWSMAGGETTLLDRAITLIAAAVDTGSHQIFDFRSGKLKLVANRSDKGRRIFKTISTRSVFGHCVKTRATIHILDTHKEKAYGVADPANGSLLLIPLTAPGSETAQGVISIKSQVAHQFNQKEVKWLEILAASLSKAWSALVEVPKPVIPPDEQRLLTLLKLPPHLQKIFALRCGLRLLPFTSDPDVRRMLNVAELLLRLGRRIDKDLNYRVTTMIDHTMARLRGAPAHRLSSHDLVEYAAALVLRLVNGRKTEGRQDFEELFRVSLQVFKNEAGGNPSDIFEPIIASELSQFKVMGEFHPQEKAHLEFFGPIWPNVKFSNARSASPPAKRVLVAGTGSRDLSPDLRKICEHLGAALAAAGYGLVCGSWPGVDDIVTRAFVRRLEITGADVKHFVQQIIEPEVAPEFRLEHAHVAQSAEDSVRIAIEGTDAVIIVEGEGGAEWVGKTALEHGVPVLPLAITYGEAAKLHKLISAHWQSFAFCGGKELFDDLAISIPRALDAALSIIETVPRRPEATAGPETPKAEEPVERNSEGRPLQKGAGILFVDTTTNHISSSRHEWEQRIMLDVIGSAFQLLISPPPTPETLPDILRSSRPQVIHFSGEVEGETALVLSRENDLRTTIQLNELLRDRQVLSSVQLIVLSACESESHARLLSSHGIDVVAMTGEPSEAESHAFLRLFYRGLHDGLTPYEAVKHSQFRMGAEDILDPGMLVFYPGAVLTGAEEVLAPPEPDSKTVTWRGKISVFGGPEDLTFEPDDRLVLVSDQHLQEDAYGIKGCFLPGATQATVRNLNPYSEYIACPWNYKDLPRHHLLSREVIVRNPANGRARAARPVDWGPRDDGGLIADMSAGLAQALGLMPGDECEVVAPLPETDFEDRVPSNQARPTTWADYPWDFDEWELLKSILPRLQSSLPQLLDQFPTNVRQSGMERMQRLAKESASTSPDKKIFSDTLHWLEETSSSVRGVQLAISRTLQDLRRLFEKRHQLDYQKFVHIIAAADDIVAHSKEVTDRLAYYGMGAFIGSTISREDLLNDDLKGLIILYGHSSPKWLNECLEEIQYLLMRKQDSLETCVCCFGPSKLQPTLVKPMWPSLTIMPWDDWQAFDQFMERFMQQPRVESLPEHHSPPREETGGTFLMS